jgi:hypothetical protein
MAWSLKESTGRYPSEGGLMKPTKQWQPTNSLFSLISVREGLCFDSRHPLQQGRFILAGCTAYPASHVAAADED